MIDGKDISPGAITNTNVNSSAGIELKKLETGGSGQIVVTDSAGTQKYVDLSGDVTVDTAGVATVSATISSGGAGSVGPQGPTGPQGPQGTQGIQGDQGVPGSDASVTATNVDNALYGADTSSTGLVKRTADNTYALDSTSYSDTSHTHDGRYYTETETDTLLATKSGTGHTHAHADLTSIVAAEHVDWAAASAGTIHATNYTHTHTLTDVTDSGTAAPLNVPATGDAASGEVVKGSDTRLSDARTPSSTLAHKASHATGAGDALSPSDIGAESAFSKNTAFNKSLGTTSGTVSEGDHTHTLTDVTDSGGAAALDVWAGVGPAAGAVCAADDGRLADTRDPNSHKASHETGGTDALSASDIGAAASIHAHDVMASGNSYAVGFVPIGSATHSNTYLRKDGTWGTPVDTNTTYTSSNFTHNDLTGHVAAEHIDWTADQGATNLHTGNYTNTTYANSDFDHDALTNFETNEHIDWTGASAGTVHASNYTNTTYSSGNSGLVPAAGSVGQFLKYDASWGTPPDTTANASITLSGDVSGTGTNAITCAVANDSHTHHTQYFQESEFLNASAGAGDAGKPVKLDAGGHIDTSMINDGDISFVDLADIPSTFAPSAHTHAHADLTSIDANQHLDWTTDRGATNLHAGNYTNTTYSVMASGSSYAAGLVATGSATHSNSFLRKDGTWVVPTGTGTYTADDGIALSVGNAFSVAAGTGLTQDASGLSLNLQGVAEAAIRVDEDYIVFLDGGSTGAAKKESIVDLATAMAGTGLTASAGELRASNSMGKYVRWITWGTTQSDITYNVAKTIATINHGLGSQYVTVALIDVDGVATVGLENSLIDIDYICIVKCIDTNNITIEWNMTWGSPAVAVPDGNEFKLTVIG